VTGALLVAPSDPEREGAPAEVASFAPQPRIRLPYAATLVVSSNDEICSQHRAAELAQAWGAELHVAGLLGHINDASGLGEWPEGQLLLLQLQARALRAL
jgi:predicted alpha/beta hydrolase family esterase